MVKADSSGVLANYHSSPKENEDLKVLSPVSEWIMNRLTYTSTAFNLKKKKIKEAEELGNKSAFPWGHSTEMKTLWLLWVLPVWQLGRESWKEQRLPEVIQMSALKFRLSHHKGKLRFESDLVWFLSSQMFWLAKKPYGAIVFNQGMHQSHLWIFLKKLFPASVLLKDQWV